MKGKLLGWLAFVAFALAMGANGCRFVQAQGLTAVVDSDTQSLDPLLSARRMKLTPVVYNENTGVLSGATQAIGEANLARFNGYFAGGWRNSRLPLQLGAYGYGIWGTVTIPALEGFRINGGGLGDTRAESEYFNRGGPVSRIVNLKPANPIMVDYAGAGMTVDGVVLGGWHTKSFTATLRNEVDKHALVGWRQRCQTNGVGSGKVHWPAGLVVYACRIGAQLGDSTLGDNADQYNIASARFPDCEIGFQSICTQSVSHTVLQFETARCGLPLDIQKGGEWFIPQMTVEVGTHTVLRTRANGIDAGRFDIGLNIDSSVDQNGLTVIDEVAYLPAGPDGIPGNGDDEGSNGGNIYHFPHYDLDADVSEPERGLMKLRGYCWVQIDRGDQLYDKFVRIQGGTSATHCPTITVEKCRFRPGEFPTDVIDDANSGHPTNPAIAVYARVVVRNNITTGGAPLPPESFLWTKVNGVASRTPLSMP